MRPNSGLFRRGRDMLETTHCVGKLPHAACPQGPQLGSREQIQELLRILGESQASDMQPDSDAGASGTDQRSGSLRVQQSPLRQFIRPRRTLIVLRSERLHQTANCRDGSVSFFEHQRGTCSRHRGVAQWE